MSEEYSSDNLYEQFAQVMNQTQDLVNKMKHLRQMIKEKQPHHSENQLSGSRQNLKELYQQGFHVCSEYYGKRLEPNESCTFCLDAIFGHEQGMTK